MSFPTNPTTGDIYVYAGKTFRWSGVAWVKIAVSPAITTANIAEVTNLYFTNTRAISAFTGGQGVNIASNGLLTGAVQYSNTDVQLYLGNVTGNIVPSANEIYSLGSSSKKWKDLFLSGNTIVLGETKLESSGDGALAIKSTNVQVTNQISFASNGYIASTAGPVQSAGAITPKISNVLVADSNYTILDDTAADALGYIVINGSLFDSQSTVVIGTLNAGSVSFVNSSQLRVRLPNLAPGTYPVYVINSDGATATRINALNISGFPTWNTASGNVGAVYESIPFNTTLNATSDSNVTYSVYSGILPTGANLNASTGNITAANAEITSSNVTYNFTINATDEQLQNTSRAFNITVIRDQVILNNRANTYQILYALVPSEYYVNATTLSGRGVTLTANVLPAGMSFDLANNKISGTPNTISNIYSVITATSNITNKSNSYNVFFEVQQALLSIEYLVVAGGGAGGGTGSGGGAGGVLCCSTQISPASYTIVVGAGGAKTTNTGTGCMGSNSSAFGTTTYGGGGGVSHGAGPGIPGGSGSGASIVTGGSAGIGGRALYGSQGNPGGNSHVDGGWNGGSGGGGGAGSAGGGSGPGYSGSGGAGLSVPGFSTIGGSPAGCFGGGGGGAAVYGGNGSGGAGGGGGGGRSSNDGGTPGTDCTGGGGGGGSFTGGGGYYGPGGNGGSGIVAVRYLISSGCNLTGGTVSCSGGYKYHVFTTSSTLTKS